MKKISDYSIGDFLKIASNGEFKELKERRIPEILLQSIEFMYPEKLDQWSEYLWDIGPVEFYCAENALKVIKALENDMPLDDAIKMYKNQTHRDGTEMYTAFLIGNFANRGPDFLETISIDGKSVGKKYIETIRKKNQVLKEKYNKETEQSIK